MVLFNYSTKELTAKVVYYGPGLCGKTTNLQWVHEKLPIKNKGKMLSLATETDRTLFFDFLPIELGAIRGMKTRIQLYTVPGQVFYNATRRMVLKGADGVVFVADSQDAMLEANAESLENLRENLEVNEISLDDVPLVLQYNKRDLPNALPIDALNARLNPRGVPHYEAVAVKGVGVEETLKGVTALVFKSLAGRYGGTEGAAAAAKTEIPKPNVVSTTMPLKPAPPALPPQPAPPPPSPPAAAADAFSPEELLDAIEVEEPLEELPGLEAEPVALEELSLDELGAEPAPAGALEAELGGAVETVDDFSPLAELEDFITPAVEPGTGAASPIGVVTEPPEPDDPFASIEVDAPAAAGFDPGALVQDRTPAAFDPGSLAAEPEPTLEAPGLDPATPGSVETAEPGPSLDPGGFDPSGLVGEASLPDAPAGAAEPELSLDPGGFDPSGLVSEAATADASPSLPSLDPAEPELSLDDVGFDPGGLIEEDVPLTAPSSYADHAPGEPELELGGIPESAPPPAGFDPLAGVELDAPSPGPEPAVAAEEDPFGASGPPQQPFDVATSLGQEAAPRPDDPRAAPEAQAGLGLEPELDISVDEADDPLAGLTAATGSAEPEPPAVAAPPPTPEPPRSPPSRQAVPDTVAAGPPPVSEAPALRVPAPPPAAARPAVPAEPPRPLGPATEPFEQPAPEPVGVGAQTSVGPAALATSAPTAEVGAASLAVAGQGTENEITIPVEVVLGPSGSTQLNLNIRLTLNFKMK